jgi:hypothetical protein
MHDIKAYGGVEIWIHSFLTSAMRRISCQFNDPAAFPREISTGDQWIGGWVHPTVGLETGDYNLSSRITTNQYL